MSVTFQYLPDSSCLGGDHNRILKISTSLYQLLTDWIAGEMENMHS